MFKPVDPKQNFPKLEEEILEFWKKNNIFEKSLKKESPKGNFVFYEGPPTANGKPGLHHILARAFKDLIPRYKTMQGFHVERKAGWDTHGLPVELEVEKKLGISGKQEIEKYGIEKFNKKCRESVWEYKSEWEKLTERIAFWLDMEHPYITYDNSYIESLWWIVKKIWDKKLLYLGHKVVPQCPRCGTALSSHEVAQGYKKVQDNSVYIKFALEDEKNTYILAWTTTPWTLPGNVALALGKDINYVKVQQENEYYILAEERLKILNGKYKIIKKYSAKDLEEKRYYPLFDFIDLEKITNKKSYYLTIADFVTTEDGTGVVHTAVMYGEDDYVLGDKIGLPKYHTVDENGKFLDIVKPWKGKFVKNVEPEIIKYLKDKKILYKTEQISHDYPFCWRCGTPLIYYAKNSWFIRMSALKKELLANNQKINWIPSYIKNGRFGEWLKDVKDWAVSRERYWGTPLPIWICQVNKNNNEKLKTKSCDNVRIIGSIAELEELSGKKLKDLHRPYVDEVRFKCERCGGIMRRVPEVMDCWFDSGAMPLAQYHYPFENKEKIDNNKAFPADYISEAIDQTRGWFYTLLAVSTILGKGNPYKNVICLGHILDSQGQKMSKSKGNVVNPWEIINNFGADALRFHLYSLNQPGDAKRFDIKGVTETFRKNILLLWNVYVFFVSYANLDNFKSRSFSSFTARKLLDKWIIAKLNLLKRDITITLDNYDVFHSARLITEFINDLSTWYLRRSRKRYDPDFYTVLYMVLFDLVKVIAPFMPFVSESIYQNLKSKRDPLSVHLCSWPKIDKDINSHDLRLINMMAKIREIVEQALAKRAKEGIKVRQPLQELRIKDKLFQEDELINIIAEEINVKRVIFVPELKESIELDTRITPELKEEGQLRELIRQIQMERKKLGLTPGDKADLNYFSDNTAINKIIIKFSDIICKETRLNSLNKVSKKVNKMQKLEIDNILLFINIIK